MAQCMSSLCRDTVKEALKGPGMLVMAAGIWRRVVAVDKKIRRAVTPTLRLVPPLAWLPFQLQGALAPDGQDTEMQEEIMAYHHSL